MNKRSGWRIDDVNEREQPSHTPMHKRYYAMQYITGYSDSRTGTLLQWSDVRSGSVFVRYSSREQDSALIRTELRRPCGSLRR